MFNLQRNLFSNSIFGSILATTLLFWRKSLTSIIVTKVTVHLPPTATSPICKSTPPPHVLLLEDEDEEEDVNCSVHSMNI